MPLKNRDYNPPPRPADSLDQARERHNHHDALQPSSTRPQASKGSQMMRSTSVTSDDGRTSNPLGAKDVPDQETKLRQKAMSLKLNVPNPFFESRPGAVRSRGGPQWSEIQSAHSKNYPETQSTFDNTESITWDEDSAAQETENQTIVFRGDQIQIPQNDADERGGSPRTQYQYANMHFGTGIEDEIAEGRKIFEQNSRGGIAPTKPPQDSVSAGMVPDISVKEAIKSLQPIIETPSRATTVPPGRNVRSLATTSKTVSFESPAIRSREIAKADSPTLSIVPLTTRSAPRGAQWSSQVGNRTPHAPESHLVNVFEPSRESDYPTSEDDIMPNPTPSSTALQNSSPKKQEPRKREMEQDLDFDAISLKAMPYKDLVDQKFSTDPRDPRHATEHDVSDVRGNAESLSQRLSNLRHMSEEEQRSMFRRQTDEEWTHIGSWFIEKFQGDLRRLMENKTERRKVSMRFESEIRRRQATVEWSLAGVEEELNSLKKGGGELIRGRDAASRRNTPQKRT